MCSRLFRTIWRTCSRVRAQKKGRIINIGSDSGKHGTACHSVYSACKAAVAGFTRAIALELAGDLSAEETIPNGPGKAWVYVEPDGDVLRGQGLYTEVLGNLVMEPWETIWAAAARKDTAKAK